jgi:hypothetical protein
MSKMDFMWRSFKLNKQNLSIALIDLIAPYTPGHEFSLRSIWLFSIILRGWRSLDMYTYIFIYIYIYTIMYTYIYMYVYVHVCVLMFEYEIVCFVCFFPCSRSDETGDSNWVQSQIWRRHLRKSQWRMEASETAERFQESVKCNEDTTVIRSFSLFLPV